MGIVTVTNLKKVYGGVAAVDGILSIGSIFESFCS